MNQTYGRLVSRAAIAATVMASLLLLIKIFAWWYTGSVSILAALVDSLVDIAASLTNLLVVRYSLQPADDEHTFGHGKAESLAALAQSMFISGSALFLFLTGIQHLVSPSPMNDPGVGVVVTIVALICTLVLVTFQRWVVRKTQSQAVRADMLHYQSDVMMNGAILIALGLAWYGWHRADALFALPRFDAPDEEYKKLSNGVPVPSDDAPVGKCALYCRGELFGIAENADGTLRLRTYLKEDNAYAGD